MCRSSEFALFLLSAVLAPTAASAQLYGFPSEVGVIDDGFGVLPPSPPRFLPPAFAEEPGPFSPPLPPPRPAPCPQVIKIGRGVHQPAHVRVVYGRPACS